MSNGHDRISGLIETMLTTADDWRLTACGLRSACPFDGPDQRGYTEP